MKALASSVRATELAPKLDRAWYGQGLALIRLRRYDEAVDALKRNTELQPMSPYGWYQLARVHVDRQQPEEAVQDHSPPQGLRAQGGGAAGARDRAADRYSTR
jgi:predicted Zn-dependent protease